MQELYRGHGSRWDGQVEYIGMACTLDGKPAKIVRQEPDGHGGTYAAVATLDGMAVVPWSWCAIYSVCDNRGGKFSA